MKSTMDTLVNQKRLQPGDIICLGASAGGLEALERFFRHLSSSPDYIFVLIQHLSPDYKSVMGELLERYTNLTNKVVEDGMEPRSGCIHLIPPTKDIELEQGVFRLRERDNVEQHLPINLFLNSLAREQPGCGAAVIFSGTGSDGSRGIEALHGTGGMVMVQRPDSAKFDGMPRNALLTGCVDYVGSPEELADLLFNDNEEQKRHLQAHDGDHFMSGQQKSARPEPEDPLERIFYYLSSKFGIDFTLYKDATTFRRIKRRMQMTGTDDYDAYAQMLAVNPLEVDRLYHDLLIGVTEFFRDRELFATLQQNIIPELLKKHPSDDAFRVWSAGCATGEEAYSLAIILDECQTELSPDTRPEFRIFATDIHRGSLRTAGAGIYSEDKMKNVSEKRRNKYFEKVPDGWRVRPFLRRMITFAPHNLLQDPPFLHMRLISCRNLMIYLLKEAQQRVLLQFAAALEKDGIITLGSSESMMDSQQEFAVVDSGLKIYRKNIDLTPSTLQELFKPHEKMGLFTAQDQLPAHPKNDILSRIYPNLLEKCMPSGLLVTQDGELLHTFGGAGRYLSISGRMSSDIASFLQGNLRVAVTTALERARKSGENVRYGSVHQPLPEAGDNMVDVTVVPLLNSPATTGQRGYFFIQITPAQVLEHIATESLSMDDAGRLRIDELEKDLFEARENLQATVEELETSNEELQATNEELLASNEELQSSNEELQSVNEQLHSVNAEYQEKNLQLIDLNDDLQNLMKCTDIGTIFLDGDLRIRRFTPAINRSFFVREQDIGRPIQEIKSLINNSDELIERIRQALQKDLVIENEVQTENGSTMLQRINPYKDSHGCVHGVVITYIDLTVIKESEYQRRQSDILREDILNSMTANIAVLDAEGNIISINKSWREFARQNQAPNLNAMDIGANYLAACAGSSDQQGDDDARRAMVGVRDVLAGLNPAFEMEYSCHSPDHQRWFLMRVTPLNRDEGGAVVTHIDITEQKKAEEEVRRSEIRLQTVMDTIDAVVYVTDLETHEIIFINETGRQTFGEVVGLPCWDAIQGKGGPCSFCRAHELFDDDGQPVNNLKWEVHCDRNGQWYESRDRAIKWVDGQNVRLSMLSDITKRKAMEQELRAHHDHLHELVKEQTASIKAIVDTAADAIITIDQQGFILTYNKAAQQMFGYDPDEALGSSVSLLMPEPHGSRHDDYLRRYLDSGESSIIGASTEVVGKRRDGSTFPMLVTVSEMKVGRERRFTGIARDITAAKQAEEELVAAREAAEAASQAKSNFLANMSHEIRTPMNAITGFSQLCLQTELNEQQYDYINKVQESCQTLLTLINDILDLSKIEAGKMELEATTFTFRDVMDHLATMMSFRAREKELDFLIDTAIDIPPYLLGDSLRLSQVLINLTGNAMKFTDQGQILVSVTVDQDLGERVVLRFSVQDTGIGIASDKLDQLFQPFSQADSSTSRLYGGTGLGLAISKQLVENMNGEIWAESEPGRGSKFIFTVNLEKAQPPATEAAGDMPVELSRCRLLVVDDSTDALQLLGNYLDDAGCEVNMAESGTDALTMIEQAINEDRAYDLVMLDWKMLYLDGIDTARKIRKKFTEQVPRLLLFSSFGYTEMHRHLDSGLFDATLSKPFTKHQLLTTINEAFNRTAEPPTGADRPQAAQNTANLAGASILLVEDNEINRQLARELLKPSGASVVVAANGREALALLTAGSFDGVLMDIQMPVLDGLNATIEIRKNPRHQDLPIIAMTANAFANDQQRYLSAGMNDCLTKPINQNEMLETLGRWIKPGRKSTVAASPAGSSPPEGKQDEPLPTIPGVDVNAGWNRMDGDTELYFEILEKFCQGQKNALAETGLALENQDINQAERLIHTLKGLCRTIGAHDAAELAAELESAVKKELPLAEIQPLLDNTATVLNELFTNVEQAVQARQSRD